MASNEFEIIQRYFYPSGGVRRPDVILGIGDDAALTRVPSDRELVTATDMLVAGVHFDASWPAQDIGHRALAVNLSDLAAMGAEPAWCMLTLSLPENDDAWLAGFSRGFLDLAACFGVQLIGGDLARGPLVMSVAVFGLIPAGRALTRAGARAGDAIYVTGDLGDAAGALALNEKDARGQAHALTTRLRRPQPRLREGLQLRELASSAIDISDGLLADLEHILEASAVGASIYAACLPLSHALTELYSLEQAQQFALTGGDDYELCFTSPDPDLHRQGRLPFKISRLGMIEAKRGLRCLDRSGETLRFERQGYRHF